MTHMRSFEPSYREIRKGVNEKSVLDYKLWINDKFWEIYNLDRDHLYIPDDDELKAKYYEVQRIAGEAIEASREKIVGQIGIGAKPIDEPIMKDFIKTMQSSGWLIKDLAIFHSDHGGVHRKGELEAVIMINPRFPGVEAYGRRKLIGPMSIDEFSAGALCEEKAVPRTRNH